MADRDGHFVTVTLRTSYGGAALELTEETIENQADAELTDAKLEGFDSSDRPSGRRGRYTTKADLARCGKRKNSAAKSVDLSLEIRDRRASQASRIDPEFLERIAASLTRPKLMAEVRKEDGSGSSVLPAGRSRPANHGPAHRHRHVGLCRRTCSAARLAVSSIAP